eukprot:2601709-Rhodomonas_salina.5
MSIPTLTRQVHTGKAIETHRRHRRKATGHLQKRVAAWAASEMPCIVSRIGEAYGETLRKNMRKAAVTNRPAAACCGDPGYMYVMSALIMNLRAASFVFAKNKTPTKVRSRAVPVPFQPQMSWLTTQTRKSHIDPRKLQAGPHLYELEIPIVHCSRDPHRQSTEPSSIGIFSGPSSIGIVFQATAPSSIRWLF